MKYLIFDAGPIISLAMSGQLGILEKLKADFKGEFIITPQVRKEAVDRPMRIEKYRLEAIEVQDLIERKILTLSSTVISDNKLERETMKILRNANGVLRSERDNQKISIIHEGEASCIAFAKLFHEQCLIVIDERTARLLGESPNSLKTLMESKLHTGITVESSLIKDFSRFDYIRSTELMMVAFKKGFVPLKKNRTVLDALLYSLKYKGVAISSKEIETLKKLAFT